MAVNLSIGFTAFLISTLLFLGILVVAFIGQRQNARGKPFFLLIIALFIWSSLLTMSQIEASIAFEMIFIAELLRYYTWFYVIQHASGSYLQRALKDYLKSPLSPFYISALFIISLITLGFNDFLVSFFNLHPINLISIIWMLVFTVIGVILVEQLFRNTPSAHRGQINYICISAGAVFIFDFFVFSNALLLQKIDYELWSARGFVNVLIAPTLLIAAARNPTLSPNIHISREFIFHSTALLGSGIYLLIMSIAGYYIKIRSGEWGELLQITFLFAALLLFTTLFFSVKIKTKVKHYINKSFSNKYNYRTEWTRFSNTLLTTDNDSNSSIYLRSLQAVCQIVDSRGAGLWLKDQDHYTFKANWQYDNILARNENTDAEIINKIIQHRTLFTTRDFTTETDHWFNNTPNSWLILPLWMNDELFGYIHLLNSEIPSSLDHEDRELLTTITHQLALFLSQHEVSIALQQADRFKSMNQMTAFLTHDLKTLLSQLFLLVENGKIHKDKPAFIDDMINTLDHVSIKMQRLVDQLKEPNQEITKEKSFIIEIIHDILQDYKHSPIKPSILNSENSNPVIDANKSKLRSALKHLIQNATESVDKNGKVEIIVSQPDNSLLKIQIKDDGKGMTKEFISNRLFQPFDSTKGVSGMGIGVYQSREYIRSLNGDIQVSSEPGLGTTFTITLPTAE